MSNKTQTEEEKIIQEVKTYLAEPKNRLKMYESYLIYIEKLPIHTPMYFLCNVFSLLIKRSLNVKVQFIPAWDLKYYTQIYSEPLLLLLKCFPEIKKPSNAFSINDRVWFNYNEKEERVKIVKKAINIVKTKYNLE
jgi:hypothetical protein